MSVPAFRNSRSRVRRRRAHHALSGTQSSQCPKCESPVLPHRACKECGYYNGRQVTGSMDKVAKELDKAATKKAETK